MIDPEEKAQILKRKELKWKLIQASLNENRRKLDVIKTDANYYKSRMIKIADAANKLRAKYIKVAKGAKLAESLYKKFEARLLIHEKHLAEQKMQLMRLEIDCRNTGTQLYGTNYHFTSMSNARKLPLPFRLSSIYNSRESVLRNFSAYRLTTKYTEAGYPLTDLIYTIKLDPNDYVCLDDLTGTCSNRECPNSHKADYMMSDIEKLADLLSYRPCLAGYKYDTTITNEENDRLGRLKCKQYAAKLIAKHPSKSVEVIAQNLVMFIRANRTDHELLLAQRELHRVKPKPNPDCSATTATTTSVALAPQKQDLHR